MRQISGLYHRRGWRVDVGEDADADAVLVASTHEAMHDRLQMTTIYGCTIALLQERAVRDDNPDGLNETLAMQRNCTRVHEEFATWMSTVPAGWGSEQLHEAFPLYVRHLRRAQLRTVGLGDYLAMHACQGLARACMQPAGLAELLGQIDAATLTVGMLDHSMRPDVRLVRLERALRARGWGALGDWTGDAVDLSPERFAEENDPDWAELNQVAYDWCRGLLETAGCPTLPYDGHLPAVRALRSALEIRAASDDPASSFVALMSVESETLVLEDPLPAVALPPGTPPGALAAGDAARRHLFLAIRPRQALLEQYRLRGAPIGDAAHLAVLRCQGDDGVVELLDVTDLDLGQLANAGPVIVSIAMSSLADEAVQRHWQLLLSQNQATVFCDLRPSVNIRGWLGVSDLRVRYTIVGVEGRVGTVRLLVFRIEDSTTTSRLYLTPVSRLYSSALLLWFAEAQDIAGRACRDDTLGDLPLVRFTAAHIVLEERLFAFTSGDTE